MTWFGIAFAFVALFVTFAGYFLVDKVIIRCGIALGFLALLLNLFLAFNPRLARAEMMIPALTGRVVDQANLLSSGEKVGLDRRIRRFETTIPANPQLAILTFKDASQISIEDFTNETFRKWSLGTKGIDNGILIAVFPSARTTRIETGRGVEEVIPDSIAIGIIADMNPLFAKGQFYPALMLGIDRIEERMQKWKP